MVFCVVILHADKYALLVETSPGWPLYTDKDTATMKELLGREYRYIVLDGKNATALNIRKALDSMSKLDKDDIFVFYFSGHGARAKNGDTSEADGQDDFLVAANVRCYQNSIDGVITDNELNYLYSRILARKLVFIDACHSQTMYRSIGESKTSKLYKGCDEGDITLRRAINPKFLNTKVNNMLHFGAAKENESAEGSKGGGIFTLSLAKSLKENNNISLSSLITKVKQNIKPVSSLYPNTRGAFEPSLYSVGVDEHNIYTKDIFARVKVKPQENSFKKFLERKLGTFSLKIHGGKEKFTLGEPIKLKAKIKDQKAYIYLVDMLDKNRYKLLDIRTSKECIALRGTKQRMCQYLDLVGMAPFGKSELYMIVTKKALHFRKASRNIVHTATNIEKQLKKYSFDVAKVSFEVYGE